MAASPIFTSTTRARTVNVGLIPGAGAHRLDRGFHVSEADDDVDDAVVLVAEIIDGEALPCINPGDWSGVYG